MVDFCNDGLKKTLGDEYSEEMTKALVARLNQNIGVAVLALSKPVQEEIPLFETKATPRDGDDDSVVPATQE